jgi:hypothetical protein
MKTKTKVEIHKTKKTLDSPYTGYLHVHGIDTPVCCKILRFEFLSSGVRVRLRVRVMMKFRG